MTSILSCIRKIKKITLCICLTAAVLGLSSCGPNMTIWGNNTQSAPTASPSATAIIPQKGGELSVPMAEMPKTAHPLYLAESSMFNLYRLVFEPLIVLDGNNLPTNCLADSWEYDSENGVYIISIRSGVKWHGDRGELTASDVVFTLEKILSDTESIYNSQLAKYVDSVALEDVSTITVKPKIKGYSLLYSLNIPIIPQAYYEQRGKEDKSIPVGSGPYTVTESNFGSGSYMLLSVNEKWWKKQPYIQTVRAKGYKNNAQAVAAFDAGELDCVYTSERTAEIYAMKDNVKWLEYSSYYYDFLAPNIQNECFRDKRVRQAISYAIDRKSLISNIYLDRAILSETPFMPGTALNNPEAKRYDNNLATARELLAHAGWVENEAGVCVKNGKELSFELITVDNTDDPVRKDTADALSKQLALIGIKVQVTMLEPEILAQRIAKRDFDMVLTGAYLSGTPDMSFMYDGQGNISGYSSEELDGILEQLVSQTDKEEFFETLYTLHSAMAEELPHIGLFFHTHTLLYRDNVHPEEVYTDLKVFEGIEKWFIAG